MPRPTKGQRTPGSGRPKGYKEPKTLEKEAARELVRTLVTAQLGPLVQAQIDNALGIKYLVTRNKITKQFIRVGEAVARVAQGSKEEEIEVWEKDPSVHAFTDLMNRALDKPKEQAFDVNLGVSEDLNRILDEGLARVAAAKTKRKKP